MSFAPYIPLAGCCFNFLLALFIFTRNPRETPNRVCLVSGMSIAIWNLGSYFLFVVPSDDHGTAVFWARFLQVGVLFEIAAFVHLSLLAVGLPARRKMLALYGFQTVLAVLNFTDWYVRDVRHLGSSGWYAVAGPAFHLLNIPYALSILSIVLLIRKRRDLPIHQRERVTPLIFAQSMLAIFGINDLMPIIGIDHYPLTNRLVYPYGSLAAVFYVIIIAYSLLQNELLGIRIGFTHIAAHVIRFSFLFAIALGLLLGVAVLSNAFTPVSLILALIVFVVSTITATLLFPRIFGGKGVQKLERRLLGDRFEYQDKVRNFIDLMPWYSDLDALIRDLHEILLRSFQIKAYQILLRDETKSSFGLFRCHPEDPARSVPDIQPNCPVLRYFEWGKGEYLALQRHNLRVATSILERDAGRQLEQLEAQFAFPLTSQNEPFGLLLVGSKLTDSPYTATDINLLVALTKNLSLVVNQIRLKTQILQSQELDLLGRMSRGMAHDLNNLLTPVLTLLQIAFETKEHFDEELLPVALRNIKSMQAYIREALFFSENLRLDLKLGRLDLVVQRSAELARAGRRKEVEVISVTPGEMLVQMDEVLMQRLIANLISNAIDASRPKSQIHVHLERVGQLDAVEWVRVRVVDQGEGIPKENLTRILKPYFTTKNRGDENRGFGLGLAISRKIVNLHGGNLSIASVLKKGTTVHFDLPIRQPANTAPSPVALSS